MSRSYLEASSHPDEARQHLARAQTELEGRRDARSDLSLDMAAGMMAYIPAVLAAHAGDPASALRHPRQALDIEETNDYHTLLLLSATQLVAACEIVLGDPVGALETLSVVDRFELALYAGDEIRALAYLALGTLDQAQGFIRINVERAAKGQIGGQVADSVLLLAALADAEGDRAVANQLLLQMGVGNHAATRMCSTELAARLNVAEEHAVAVRRARTAHDSRGPATAMTALHHELIWRG